MKIRRRETWGQLIYDTASHEFVCRVSGHALELPYVTEPVVLNCDLTLRCNMECRHCVAWDMRRVVKDDLDVSVRLLRAINRSCFMVVVITGGEPLLPECEGALLRLVRGLSGKGIVVDTNGTVTPSDRVLRAFRQKHVLVRVSLDSLRALDETCLRGYFPSDRSKRATKAMKARSKAAYERKLVLIRHLSQAGVAVAAQAVLHKKNCISIQAMPKTLAAWGIKSLYVQRLIPTRRLPSSGKKFKKLVLEQRKYESYLNQLEKKCAAVGVRCVTKRDRRHNCVFLLVGEGDVYTQGEFRGRKLPLGRLEEMEKKDSFFASVSGPDHSARYYSRPSCRPERRQ